MTVEIFVGNCCCRRELGVEEIWGEANANDSLGCLRSDLHEPSTASACGRVKGEVLRRGLREILDGFCARAARPAAERVVRLGVSNGR